MHDPTVLERSQAPKVDGLANGKLTVLSLGEDPPPAIQGTLERIADLPFVESVLALPDVHWKEQMEVPSSIAVTTRDVIVPEFTSVAVNDGMGIVRTGLVASDVSPERLRRFFTAVNAHAAAHFFDTNRYSISLPELRGLVIDGARALLGRYELDSSVLACMEDGGCVPSIGDEGESLAEVVPLQLMTRFSRSEMGLNFGGNHFLEVQVVDQVVAPEVASRWGFATGEVVVMYHLGPGPFGGTLLNHFSRRIKLPPARVPLFFVSKLLFHYVQRMGLGRSSKKWGIHFRHNGWTPLPADSDEGRLLRGAMRMAINFGYGYRLATMRAIRDGLHEAISPQLNVNPFCDISHNGAVEELSPQGYSWVARHNACRMEPEKPTIVAGAHDVPSYLGIGGEGMGGRLTSYDHGAGHLIDRYREANRLAPVEGRVTRLRMTRGRDAKIVSDHDIPLLSAEPIDRLMECLENNGIMRPVVRLRPIGNLKN